MGAYWSAPGPVSEGGGAVKTIRLMLVEEVRLVRELLKGLLNEQPDIHVVALLYESSAVLIRARELAPDVLLLGTVYPEDERLRLVSSLRTLAPDLKIVVIDFHSADKSLISYVRAGAHGFILHDTSAENMLHVIRLAAAGELALPQQVSAAAGTPNGEHHPPLADLLQGERPPQLTKREAEIADLICQGRSNKEIAGELHLSLHTVKSHVRRVLEKLALHSRVQIAAFGYRSGAQGTHEHLIQQD